MLSTSGAFPAPPFFLPRAVDCEMPKSFYGVMIYRWDRTRSARMGSWVIFKEDLSKDQAIHLALTMNRLGKETCAVQYPEVFDGRETLDNDVMLMRELFQYRWDSDCVFVSGP